MQASRFLVWADTPEGLAECEAYIEWSNTAAPQWWLNGDLLQQTTVRRDRWGQPWCQVCEALPDWSAPEGEEAQRPHGVLQNSIDLPQIEE